MRALLKVLSISAPKMPMNSFGASMYTHFLIAIDGSGFAQQSVEHGLALASRTKAKVTFLNATEPFPMFDWERPMAGYSAVDDALDDQCWMGVLCPGRLARRMSLRRASFGAYRSPFAGGLFAPTCARKIGVVSGDG